MDMTLKRTASLLLALWLGAFSHLLVAADVTVNRTTDGGQQVVRDDLTLLSVVGDPATLGRQAGELLAPQTQAMLTALSFHPAMAAMLQPGVADKRVAEISQEYRDEITSWAETATCDPKLLLRANVAVDVFCTAVVRLSDPVKNQPLMVARNMDFAPAQLFGAKTVLIIRRPTAHHASLSIGWPGYAGVVSGMNDAGVTAFLLLNHGAKRNEAGDSLGFRLRAILDQAGSLDEAVTVFSSAPIASSNYVLLADATSAAVVWWNGGMMQRVDPTDKWLFYTNTQINADSHLPENARGQHAYELTRLRRNPDVEWMKHLLTATYMPGTIIAMNAQAMVLVPATRSVHLATYGLKAAALSPWHTIDGARLMAGDDLMAVPLLTSPAIADPFPHYAAKPRP
ncbi:MAG TPA: C45 family peptidase [Planctomycetota bacterium]|nr:C45 family peptidase [Planctomycetota bacterium]